eukprot:gene10526-7466_t
MRLSYKAPLRSKDKFRVLAGVSRVTGARAVMDEVILKSVTNGDGDKYWQAERRWATISEYMQYSEGYLEVHLDDSGGAWAPLYCPRGKNIKYRGKPENTENFR